MEATNEKTVMKRLHNLSDYSIVLTILLLFICQVYGIHIALAEETTPSNYLTYGNSIYGIEVRYPADWTKVDQGLPVFGENTTVVVFFAPSLDIHVTLLVDKLAPRTTLTQYTEEELDSLLKIPNASSVKLIESDQTTLAHNPAHKLVVSQTISTPIGNIPIMSTHVFTVMNDKAYDIVFGGSPDNYSTYLATALQIINSFEITNNTTTHFSGSNMTHLPP